MAAETVWEDAVRLHTTGERCAGGAVLDGVRLVFRLPFLLWPIWGT